MTKKKEEEEGGEEEEEEEEEGSEQLRREIGDGEEWRWDPAPL